MGIVFKRKLYPRGGSYETTIPIQMLFGIDTEKKHDVLFEYDKDKNRWYVEFHQVKNIKEKHGKGT